MERKIQMKWLVLLIGLLCSVGMGATDVSSASALKNALGNNATVSGNTVTLTGDISRSETINIKGGNITLDLNGYTLKNGTYRSGLSTSYYKIQIITVSDGNVTITDNSNSGAGRIYVYYPSSFFDTDIIELISVSIEGGNVTLKKGTVESDCARYEATGLKISNDASFIMEGGTIKATATINVANEYNATALKVVGGSVSLKAGNLQGDAKGTGIGYAVQSNQPFSSICKTGYGIYENKELQTMTNTEVLGSVEIKPITYTISYDGIDGATVTGNLPTTYTVESPAISISATASKDYYDFLGWILDKDVKETVTIPAGSTGNKIVKAQWREKSYSITYHLNEGTNAEGNKDTYTYSEDKSTSLYEPSRLYYTFDGWYKDEDFEHLFGNEIPAKQNGPLVLYAKWTAEEYAVKFYDGDTELTEYDKTRSEEKGILESEMPKPSKEGYVFLYWKDSNGQTVTKVDPGHESLTLTAEWKVVSYLVKYVSNGGTSLNDDSYTRETVTNLTWKTEDHIQKDGYVFKGWFLQSDYSGNALTAFPLDANLGSVSADQTVVTYTFYAKWELKEYSIVFENCEGVNNKEYSIEEGVSKENMPTPNPRNGYTFEGWYDKNGKLVTSIDKGIGDLYLRAEWNPIEYTIKYETNGGTISGETTKYTIENKIILVTPTKDHYTFAGWYTDAQLTNRFEGDQLVQSYGDKTFYAKWSPKTYTLTFETNGGNEIQSQSYVYGEETKFARKTYKTAYTFAGWYKDQALTDFFGDNISATVNGDLTLYAKWTPTKYTITYNTYYGEISSGKVDTYTIEQEVTLPTDVHREGFTFADWYADDLLTTKITKIEKGNYGDKTVYATWDRGYQLIVTQPTYGKITVTRNGSAVAAGSMVGKGETLVVSATATTSGYALKKLTIDGKEYTSSPQTVTMPEKDLVITAEFAASNLPSVSAPKIVTDPASTNKVAFGTKVKVSLEKSDASSTLYYALNDELARAYEGEFLVDGALADTVVVYAIARKSGYSDGITTRKVIFDGRIELTFDLPTGVKATNPTGGEVVAATVKGGSFEFKLAIDTALFASMDSMQVLANDSVIKPNASGLYTLTNQTGNVKVTVSGLNLKECTVTLVQTENGQVAFADASEEESLKVAYGDTITLVATADADYKFLEWSDGNQSNPRQLVVTKDVSLSAKFISDYKAYAMILPEMEGVTVKPFSGYTTEVKRGDTFMFYLVIAKGYHETNLVVKANGEVLTKNKGGYAIYKVDRNISISVEGIERDTTAWVLPSEHISAWDLNTQKDATQLPLYDEDQVLLYAEAPEGQLFYKWNDGKIDNPRVATVVEAAQLIPLYNTAESGETYAKIDLRQSAGAGITVVDANVDAVHEGEDLQLKVVVLPAYSQSEIVLTANGETIEPQTALRASTETRTYLYTLPSIADYTEVKLSGLVLNTYKVTTEQTDGGSVSASASSAKHGEAVQLQATPSAGMIFAKWWDGNTVNPYPYQVTSDVEVKALFMGEASTVANEEIEASVVRLSVSGSTLYIESVEAAPLYLWDYKGSLLYHLNLPAGTYPISLPAGIYLVKVGDSRPEKIVVR